MLPTSIRPYCHALAVLVVLLPVSVSADESPACHHWSSSIDDEPMDGTIEAAFHPFFSIATGRDVTRCLATGANPNSRTKEGLTPLHFAAAFSNFETVIIALLDAGADLHARSESGESPLHLAAVNSTLDVTLTLLEAGANVDARGQLRTTPLHYAASINKSERIVNALIEGGADPNARTEGGETPLHLAAMVNANPAVVVALLDGGADPIARDDGDETPWDYANDNESLKGTTAYWCLNDARWRAMDSDDQRTRPLPSWCRSLVSVEEKASSNTPNIEVGASETESQPIGESRVRHGDQSAAVPDYVQQDIVQHKDWIESCTDLPVLVVDQDLILYYIDVERGHEEIIQCLLSKVSRVMEACGADGGTNAMYLPPFPNSQSPRDGSPVRVPEALIRTGERILIVSGARGDLGIECVQPVSENSFVVQLGYLTHSRVFYVDPDSMESVYVTNGHVAEIDSGHGGCLRILVKSHKRYFEDGGAFWLDAIVDCEGNILDVLTRTSDCMSVKTLSEKSGVDLSRVEKQEICVER